jgi:hypothetical protein
MESGLSVRRKDPMPAALRSTSLLSLLLGLAAPAQAAVEYELVYEAFWTGAHNESGSLPGGAHFTPMIGATHTANPLWTPGNLAGPPLEQVAETGGTVLMSNRIQNRIASGTADSQIDLDDVFTFPTTQTIAIIVDPAFSQVSLAAMVAPSPDWFVGVSDVDLAPGGVFLDEVVVDLMPYDAGTEEGDDFVLLNPDTDPPEPIALVNGTPFHGSPVIGRITFRKVEPVPALGLGPMAFGSAAMLLVGWTRLRGRS